MEACLADWLDDWRNGYPPHNVWLGTSAEDQQRADERIPVLLEIPAKVRFVSYEPALGPIDWSVRYGHANISWVICGGESGPHARRFDLAWARDTIRQCKEAGTACFIKQLGARPFDSEARISIDGPDSHAVAMDLHDKAGADPNEWPIGLRVQQFPEVTKGVAS